MIKKWVNKACYQYFEEKLSHQIIENKVARVEAKIVQEQQLKEVKRHNALVEGWLKAFMTAQGVALPDGGKS